MTVADPDHGFMSGRNGLGSVVDGTNFRDRVGPRTMLTFNKFLQRTAGGWCGSSVGVSPFSNRLERA